MKKPASESKPAFLWVGVIFFSAALRRCGSDFFA
jgi:hypothetical protein